MAGSSRIIRNGSASPLGCIIARTAQLIRKGIEICWHPRTHFGVQPARCLKHGLCRAECTSATENTIAARGWDEQPAFSTRARRNPARAMRGHVLRRSNNEKLTMSRIRL